MLLIIFFLAHMEQFGVHKKEIFLRSVDNKKKTPTNLGEFFFVFFSSSDFIVPNSCDSIIFISFFSLCLFSFICLFFVVVDFGCFLLNVVLSKMNYVHSLKPSAYPNIGNRFQFLRSIFVWTNLIGGINCSIRRTTDDTFGFRSSIPKPIGDSLTDYQICFCSSFSVFLSLSLPFSLSMFSGVF